MDVGSANTEIATVARYAVLLDHRGTLKDGQTTITVMMLNQVPPDAIYAGTRFDRPDRKTYWTKSYKAFVEEQYDGKKNLTLK